MSHSWELMWLSFAAVTFQTASRRWRIGARKELFGWIPLIGGCVVASKAPEIHAFVGLSTILISGGCLLLGQLFLKQIRPQ